MTRQEQRARLLLIADRAAWLRNEAPEVRDQVLTDLAASTAYWAHTEATAGWAAFVVERRARELRRAIFRKRARS